MGAGPDGHPAPHILRLTGRPHRRGKPAPSHTADRHGTAIVEEDGE